MVRLFSHFFDEDNFIRLAEKDSFLSDLFRSAMQNDDFRALFVKTFREITVQNFDANRVKAEIDTLESVYRDAAIDTHRRFWSDWQSVSSANYNYQDEIDVVRDFYSKRGDLILSYLDAHFGAKTGDSLNSGKT